MASPRFARPGGPSLIPALGVTQVFGYGTLFYAFTVLAPRMTADFGWAPEWTFGGFAVGLLLGGAVAPITGSLIDRYGTRLVMTTGSGLAGLSLFVLAEARGIVSYTLAMAALQAVTTAVFYDAAFAALTQARGSQARRAISQLTLIGGFASTLFWPLTSSLLAFLDWRGVYRLYGLSQILICLPLHLVFLPGRVKRPVAEAGALAPSVAQEPETAYLTGDIRRRAFLLLALALSLQGFVVSAMAVHMLALLQGFGLSAAVAVGIGAMLGPSQVAGRLTEMLFGRGVAPVTTAWVSAWLMPFGLVLLLLGGSLPAVAGLFAIAFGISMGLSSIVRGTVPLQLFGPVGFGATMGKLAAPGLVIKAAAPLVFAIALERGGVMLSTLLLIAFSAFAAGALMLLARGRSA
ncbi:MFS family permease [Bosea sp. BE271]|uniref:MFS transporter n=1 Tax=Bosea TaxID=85413 RepID=UPI00286007EE|nr:MULTISPECIES: MFS transporter [Bosea]MDR6829820.1 MFS family permease [Bosea robiniae]MDR6896703.1 MFS family permease [Bosea sp. BE109]MDR7140275.1 MFS family permease [Bosea sp. BE168]MDR7176972.1 MFS family permease [Bosea sp. BE271]